MVARRTEFVYTFVNPELIFRSMKAAMKDCQRAAITREECREIIESLCVKLTMGKPETVMSFPELQEHLQQHLQQNERVALYGI